MTADTAPRARVAALIGTASELGRGFFVALVVAIAAQFLSEHYGAPAMLMALLLGIAFHPATRVRRRRSGDRADRRRDAVHRHRGAGGTGVAELTSRCAARARTVAIAWAAAAGLTLAGVASVASGAPAGAAAPRTVSINLCADQLLLELADSAQIASLSRLAHDPAASHHLERARRLPVNDGTAEPVLALAPDAVIAGEYSSHYTVRLLEASGLTVHRLPIASSMEEMLDNLLMLGEWIDRDDRAAALVTDLRERLDRVSADVPANTAPDASAPLAAVYDPNGYTVGPDSLRGDMLRRAGFRNVAEVAGIDGYGRLSLESLLVHEPQVLIDSPFSPGTWSRAQALSLHPALRQRGLAPEVITLSSADTICGGPWSVTLIERLVERRRELMAATRPDDRS